MVGGTDTLTVMTAEGREAAPPSPRELLDIAERAATRAGEELLRRHGRTGGVSTKSSATDPVSDADRASEELLVSELIGARPHDGVLGEEGADRTGTSGLHWVLDPLDGTVNYLYGFPGWCVSVAVADRSGALVGVVRDPVRDETFTAVRGQGSWLVDRRLHVNELDDLRSALVGTGFSYEAEHRRRQAAVVADLLPAVRDIRRAGSAALDLCYVAAGRLDAFYEDAINYWDWAAGALIAAEARATVSPLDGPGGRSGVLAAAGPVHDALRALVTAAAPRSTEGG